MAIELLDALLRNVAIAAVAWLPTRPAEHLSDVGLAIAPVVAGVAVNDKALAVGPWPYRQRAIAPIVAGAGTHHLAADNVAAERTL
jgi:hypothetical protein